MILLLLNSTVASIAIQKEGEIRYIKGGRALESRSNTRVVFLRPRRSVSGAATRENTREATVPATIRLPICASLKPSAFR